MIDNKIQSLTPQNLKEKTPNLFNTRINFFLLIIRPIKKYDFKIIFNPSPAFNELYINNKIKYCIAPFL